MMANEEEQNEQRRRLLCRSVSGSRHHQPNLAHSHTQEAMTAQELARFLREDADDLRIMARGFANGQKVLKCLDALSAAVELLRQAEGVIAQAQWGPDMNKCPYCDNPRPNHMGGCWLSDTLTALATLRLVVGEKETA